MEFGLNQRAEAYGRDMITTPGSNFPADLGFLIGMPLVALPSAALLWLASDRGVPWMSAYAGAILIMILGTVKLFRAKLPLYRQKRFFTWGTKGLPEASVPLYGQAIRFILAGIYTAIFLLLPKLTMG